MNTVYKGVLILVIATIIATFIYMHMGDLV